MMPNTHDQLNMFIEPIKVIEKLQCKRKMMYAKSVVVKTLDDNIEVKIVHLGFTTKIKQIQCMKVATKATKSKKTTTKEKHEDGEFGVLKN